MSNGPEDPRSEWDPLGWELEDSNEQPRNVPAPRQVEVVEWLPQASPPLQPRNPAVIMLVSSVLLAVLGLVGIGIGVGSIFFNRDAPPPEIVVVSGPQVVSAPAEAPTLQTPLVVAPSDQTPSGESPGADQLPSPLVPDDPVVAVARAVIPSVVLIEVNVGELDQEIPVLPDFEEDVPGLEDDIPDLESELPDDAPRYGQGSGIIYDASGPDSDQRPRSRRS